MAGSINKVFLIGNLGRDPEVRTMSNGQKVANLSVATSEAWKDRQTGERRVRTEWHRVSVFGPVAEIVERYCRKGSKVHIDGALETRKWRDQAGRDRYTTEVVVRSLRGSLTLLSPRQDGRAPPPARAPFPPTPAAVGTQAPPMGHGDRASPSPGASGYGQGGYGQGNYLGGDVDLGYDVDRTIPF